MHNRLARSEEALKTLREKIHATISFHDREAEIEEKLNDDIKTVTKMLEAKSGSNAQGRLRKRGPEG
eukprot:1371170-Amorphochlora_amoeboformis.AAC.2